MNRISNIALGIIIILLMIAFIPAAMIVSRQHLFEWMDAVCVAVGTGVTVGYSRSMWQAVRLPPHRATAAHLVVIGVWLVSISTAVIFSGLWLWRVQGKPDWIADSAIIAFSRWVLGIGLILSLLTSYSKKGVIVIRDYRKSAFIITAAILVAGLAMVFGLG